MNQLAKMGHWLTPSLIHLNILLLIQIYIHPYPISQFKIVVVDVYLFTTFLKSFSKFLSLWEGGVPYT